MIYDHPAYEKIKNFFQEPDYWRTCAFGLPLVFKRNWSKSWCGYVGVQKGHPHYGLSGGDRVAVPDRDHVVIGGQSPIAIFIETLQDDDSHISIDLLYDVHGGITWAAERVPGEDADGHWWFGFDCSHYNDYSVHDALDEINSGDMWRPGQYRDLKYAHSQAVALANQLSDWTSDYPEYFKEPK